MRGLLHPFKKALNFLDGGEKLNKGAYLVIIKKYKGPRILMEQFPDPGKK